ncbi:MAG: hypothetical protein M3209_03110 [Acidobacteriota bacterium]|nr:hypothetical protein [Acidobacteriota bacterium]
MKKRDLQEEKLKIAERLLLRAGKMSDAEIEKIVAAPLLFERVRENISAEESRRETKFKNTFALPNFQFWSWQRSVLGFAAIAILIVSVTAAFVRFSGAPEKAQQTEFKENQSATALVEKQPEIVSPQTTEVLKNEFQPRRIDSVKKGKSKNPPQDLQKSARAKRQLTPKFENQTEEPFIALTYAGDLANEESQIVRVEMTPARLLALGVGVQTENESEKIKTDLLVGSDGVARAIRLVK